MIEGGSVDVVVEIVGNISLERGFDVFITIDPPIRGRLISVAVNIERVIPPLC